MSGCAETEPYALQVLGDSMEPEFHDGCIVIVEPGISIEDGCYVIADHDDEPILRQLIIESDGWWLRPLNDHYPMLELKDRTKIRGRVIQRSGKRRSDRKRYI